MTKLEELIKELCPNGVEYKTLGELGEFYGGLTGKSKNDFIDGNAKFITYMNVYKNLKLNLDVEDKVLIGENENQRTIEYGDVLFTGSSETPDECGISSVLANKTDEPLYLNSFCISYRFNDKTLFNPEFSKYLFRSDSLRKQIVKTASGVTRFNVSKEKMKKVTIPIVPLEIQNEITCILDKFTSLTAELTAELTARRKQYEYYRDLLLTRETKVVTAKLGDICEMRAGKAISAMEISQEKQDNYFPVYGGNGLRGYLNRFSHEGCYSIIGRQGALCGNVQYAEGQFYATEHAVVVKILKDLDSRYLFHLLTWMNLNQYKSAGAQPGLAVSTLEKLEIKYPKLETQVKIANVLDNFDSICTDLKIGLPAEIEARKKQYEYYRDLLLTFANSGNTILSEQNRTEQNRTEQNR